MYNSFCFFTGVAVSEWEHILDTECDFVKSRVLRVLVSLETGGYGAVVMM